MVHIIEQLLQSPWIVLCIILIKFLQRLLHRRELGLQVRYDSTIEQGKAPPNARVEWS